LGWSRASLTRLAQSLGTDKAGVHKYTQHYENHLRQLKWARFALLEIGVGGYAAKGQGGESLRMWSSFFPKAQVIGLDIEDKSFVEGRNIRIYQGHQTDEPLLRRIAAEAGLLKVIVDDGSHRPAHIRETFRVLFPLLASGGIYAIEDTQTSYWPEWGGSEDLQDSGTTMALVKSLLDGTEL
jgi:demethylmacrocin O-methyltransferase